MCVSVCLSLEEYHIIPMAGTQVRNNAWVWYSHNILCMKMSNKSVSQIIDLSIMNGRCPLDSQDEITNWHPTNIGNFTFRCTDNNHTYNYTSRDIKMKWSWGSNKYVKYCCFKSKPTQRGYRKRIAELWKESVKFHTRSQRHPEQARMILIKGLFF